MTNLDRRMRTTSYILGSFLVVTLLTSPMAAHGQILKKLKEKVDKVEKTITDKLDRKADKEIDRQMETIEKGIDDPSSGKSAADGGKDSANAPVTLGRFTGSASPWIGDDTKTIVGRASMAGLAIVITDGTTHNIYLSTCEIRPNAPSDIRVLGTSAALGNHPFAFENRNSPFQSIRIYSKGKMLTAGDVRGGWLEITTMTPTHWAGKMSTSFEHFVPGQGMKQIQLETSFQAKVGEPGADRTMCSDMQSPTPEVAGKPIEVNGPADRRWTIEGVYLGMSLAEAFRALESAGYKRLAVSYSFQRRRPGSTKPDGVVVEEDSKGRVLGIRHAIPIAQPDWTTKREELVRRFGQPDSCIGPGPARSTTFSTTFPLPPGATVIPSCKWSRQVGDQQHDLRVSVGREYEEYVLGAYEMK